MCSTRGPRGSIPLRPSGRASRSGWTRAALDIEGWVNGERRQASNTRQLIFSVAQIVAFVSAVMTLLPGDVIATGTPSGVGPLKAAIASR